MGLLVRHFGATAPASGRGMVEDAMLPGESLPGATAVASRVVFISYKRGAEPDTTLANFLHDALKNGGHDVFMDIKRVRDFDVYGEEIDAAIVRSDFFIVILTNEACKSGNIAAEAELAVYGETNAGHPRILPVRASYTEPLTFRLRAAVGHLNHFEWRDTSDNERLLEAILYAIARSQPPKVLWPQVQQGPEVNLNPVLVMPSAPPPSASHLPSVSPSAKGAVIGGDLWESAPARQLLGATMVVGVRAGEEASLPVTRSAGPGFFRARIQGDGALDVAIWSGADYRRVQSQPGEFIRLVQDDHHTWCFAKHQPQESVTLKHRPGTVEPIAASFDTAIVKIAWTIVHRRGPTEENFLIVSREAQP
jgi:TIR domain